MSAIRPDWTRSEIDVAMLPPAMGQHGLLLPLDDGQITLLGADDGKTLALRDLASRPSCGPATIEGVVVLGTDDSAVVALDDALSGPIHWVVSLNEGRIVGLASASGLLVVACESGMLVCLDLARGSELWRHRPDRVAFHDLVVSPAIVGEAVIWGGEDHVWRCHHLRSGECIWQAAASFWVQTTITSSLGVTVHVDFQSVVGRSLVDGRELWRFELQGESRLSPVAVGDLVLVVDADDSVVSLAVATGLLQWRYKLDAPLIDSPVACRHGVLLAGCEGDLTVIDINLGKPLRRVQTARALGATPLLRGGVCFLVSTDRVVTAIASPAECRCPYLMERKDPRRLG